MTSPARLRTWFAVRMQRVTLRRRIIAILLALLLISCAAVAAVTALLLHDFLLKRLDQQLATAGNRYSVALEHADGGTVDDSRFSSVVGQPSGTLGARILSGQVTAIAVIAVLTDRPGPTPSTCPSSASTG